MAILVYDMYISRLMVFSQQREQYKIRKEKKRIIMDKESSDGQGCSKNLQKFSAEGHLVLLRMRMKGCLTLDLKGGMNIPDLLA